MKNIRDYLYPLANDKVASTSTLNTAISPAKFYYGEVLKNIYSAGLRVSEVVKLKLEDIKKVIFEPR